MRWRRFVLLGLAGAMVLALAFLGGSFYYARTLEADALSVDHSLPRRDVRVVAVDEGSVTLSADSEGDWSRPGTWGLEWEGGYGRITSIRSPDAGTVTREFVVLEGALEAGESVHVDRFAFPGDPARAYGVPFESVTYASDAGELGAWLVRGDPSTWAIFVHGRSSPRAEALRLLRPVHEAGATAMVIDYRNDAGAPRSADGYYNFGESEWHDVEGAVAYALQNGAERLILVGYSMGGGAVAAFLERSALAPEITAVVLDSPLLDFGTAVDYQAGRRNAPGPLTRFGKWLAGRMFGIDWDARNYLDGAALLQAPILVFHGTEDDTVPLETSERLASLRPDLVRLVTVEGAPHVGSWNLDPAAYEATVRDFLAEKAGLQR